MNQINQITPQWTTQRKIHKSSKSKHRMPKKTKTIDTQFLKQKAQSRIPTNPHPASTKPSTTCNNPNPNPKKKKKEKTNKQTKRSPNRTQ